MKRRRLWNERPKCADERARRRGSLLLQMLVVITVMSMLLSMGCVFMIRLFRMNSQALLRLDATNTRQRLVRDFQRDAHRASTGALIEQPSPRIVFSDGDARITWLVRDGVLCRVSQDTTDNSAPDTKPGEEFPLHNATWRLSVREPTESVPARLAELTSIRVPEPDGSAHPDESIVAVVGFDQRFVREKAQP